MATVTRATGPALKPYRLDARQYLAMVGAGVFPDDARVELLDGMPVEQMTKNPPHDFTVGRLAARLRQVLPSPWLVREEKSVELGRFWRPEPDLSIVRGPDDLFESRAPRAEDLGLLIEVSESSYATDRGLKWRHYAKFRVSIYWIVNLDKRRIEVFRDPIGRRKNASYRQTTLFEADTPVPLVIDGVEIGRIAVEDILPRA